MGQLKNPRHETFAQEMAKGLPASRAYRAAGYACKTDNVAEVGASKLVRNIQVSNRIQELKQAGAKRAEITVESLAAELEEVRQAALEAGNHAAAATAILGKARITGHYVGERQNNRSPLQDAPDDVVRDEIKRLAAELGGSNGTVRH